MKKLIPAVIAFSMLVCMLICITVPASADSVPVYVKSGYNGNETEFFSPDELSHIKRLSFSASGYSFSGDVDNHSRKMTHGILCAYANLYDGEAPDRVFEGTSSLALSYSNRNIHLDDYSVLRFGISAAGSGENIPGEYSASAVLTTDDGTSHSFDFEVSSSSWSLVSIDIGNIDGQLESISISVDYDRESLPDLLICSVPYLDMNEEKAFVSSLRFSSDRLTAAVGMVAPSSGRVRPAYGSAEITGALLTSASPEHGTTAYFAVRLSGISSGSLSLGISYVGTTDEQRYYTNKIALNDSSESPETVLFPVDMLSDIASFTLFFNDIECDLTFFIESIRLIEGQSVPGSANYGIGALPTLRRNGNTITFEGTMQRDAVRRFSDGTIGFYAIPSKTADDLNTAYHLGSIRVSTVFSYTADFSSSAGMCDTFMFFAAVPAKDETGNSFLMPISRPRYPDASHLAGGDVSIPGFSDAASVGIFEANAAHVTVDIDLSRLVTDDADGITVTYKDFDSKGGETRRLRFSHSLLSSLDREIEFYISSGTRVYLRLTASSAIEGLTYSRSAMYFMPDMSASGAQYYWAAVVRYLSERYSGISGFVLGHGVNCAQYVSRNAFITNGETDFDKLTEYAASLALLTRITYTAASVCIDDMPVIVPFVPENHASSTAPASLIALLLTERLTEIGNIPWVLQWMTESLGEDSDEEFNELTRLRRRLEELELPLPSAYTFFLTPDSNQMLNDYGYYAEAQHALGKAVPDYSEYAAGIFEEYFRKCQSYRGSAAFVSLKDNPLKNDHTFYSAIKDIGMTDRFVYEDEAVNAVSDSASNYTLFDFSDKHYPLGWIAGGGVKSCVTESNPLFASNADGYSRILRSEFSDDLGFVDNEGNISSGIAGITLRNLSRVFNFSDIDNMEFTLALEPADASGVFRGDAAVVLMLGNDDYRAEYYAPHASVGGILTLSCDLTDYEYKNAVDYIGIMVYADSPVYLDLSKVRLGSNTLTDDELAGMFRSAGDEHPSQDLVSAGLVLALAAVISVMAIVILTHHDREEDEKRAAALAEATKHRRNRYERK